MFGGFVSFGLVLVVLGIYTVLGESKAEVCAAGGCVFDPDSAAVQFDKFFANGQTQTCAVRARADMSFNLHEAVEDPV